MAATKGGLIPHSNMLGGATDSSGTQQFFIKASESADYFQGDLCLIDANGEIQPSTAVTDTVTVGVFQGCQYVDNNGDTKFSNTYNSTITNGSTIAHLITNPLQVYRIRIANGDANVDTFTRVEIGRNFDIEYNGGSTASGLSGMCLDSGTGGATTVAQLKLIGLTDADGSDSPITAVRATTYSYGLVILESSINRYLSVTGI